jgi:site-specific recombinase XerD
MLPDTMQKTFLETIVVPEMEQWVIGWITAKRAEGRSAGTLKGYRDKVEGFLSFCAERNIRTIDAIDASLIREWVLSLAERHKPSTVNNYFRALRTWFYWYEVEIGDPTFRNPMRKVKPPKVPDELQDPVELRDVHAMIETCGNDRRGVRDRAILRALLDTGARASELCSLDLADFDSPTGDLAIRRGKGGKGRHAFLGQNARRAVRAWIKKRGPELGPLFWGWTHERLHYRGLYSILEARAAKAGLNKVPSPHDFRRACAITMLRNGADVVTVSRLLGHSTLQMTTKYLKQIPDDLRASHAANSPVDRGNL